ncbi:MAG: N-acetylmuramoyl-L-alanine amidase [Myxococcota bacterium]
MGIALSIFVSLATGLTVSVTDGPVKSESWVTMTVTRSSPVTGPWAVRFKPTPLVRRVAATGLCRQNTDRHFEVHGESGDTELSVALQLGPGTEGRLRLGTLNLDDEHAVVLVNLERKLKVRKRPAGMRHCGKPVLSPARLKRVRKPAVPATCKLAGYHVMLDPGHGPEKQGGVSARGMPEFEFNDALAADTERALRRHQRLRVSLTRTPGEDLGLAARVALINKKAPDLLVSLHHDSTSPRRRKQTEVDGQTVSSCTEHRGFSVYLDTVRDTGPSSYHLARRVSDRYLAAGLPVGRYFFWGQLERGIYNGDMLYLLRRVRVPAVLIESGFICNHEEERRLGDKNYRQRLATLIADAIVQTLVETRCEEPEPLDASGLLYPPFG